MKYRIGRIAAPILLALLLSSCALVSGGVYEAQLMEGTVTRGPLAQQILAQGSVDAQEVLSVKSPLKFVMADYLVSEGQAVEPDTVLCEIPAEQIAENLEDVQKKIVDKKLEIATSSAGRTYYSYKAPVAGRVKSIQVKKGDDVAAVMSDVGYVALISTENRMTVLLSPAGSLAVDDEVTVNVGRKKFTGTVTAVDSKGAQVSIPDDTQTIGAEAVVLGADGAELGRGPLELAAYQIVDAVMGEVSSVSVKENAKVDMGATIVVASKASGELMTKFQELADLQEEEQTLLAMEGGQPIVAGVSGIVMSLPVQTGAEVLKDAPVAAIAVPESMIIKTQVDELDVASVYLGQSARVQVAALGDQQFMGTVSYISNKATIEEGNYMATPTFTVYITLEQNEGLSMGMSVLTYIIIDEQSDVLQVPVGALTSTEDGNLAVRVVDENAKPEKDAVNPPYTLVNVTVGMKNQVAAQILTGLTEGQKILYDPWASDVPYNYGGMEPMPADIITEKEAVREAAGDTTEVQPAPAD